MTDTDLSVRDRILAAKAAGTLTQALWDIRRKQRAELITALTDLHHAGHINVFRDLVAEVTTGKPRHVPFLIREVLGDMLNAVQYDLGDFLHSLSNIVRATTGDALHGGILEKLVEHLASRASAAEKMLGLCTDDFAQLGTLIPAILIGGSCADFDVFHGHALRLASQERTEGPHAAIFALGRMNYDKRPDQRESTGVFISQWAMLHTEDRPTATAISALMRLYPGCRGLAIERIQEWIVAPGQRGGPETALQLALLLCDKSHAVRDDALDSILGVIARSASQDTNLISVIDIAVSILLESGEIERGLTLIERMVDRDIDAVSHRQFESFSHYVCTSEDVLSHTVSRWLYRGRFNLCDFVEAMIGESFQNPPNIRIDQRIIQSDVRAPLLIARRATGYLFTHKETAASIVISAATCYLEPGREPLLEETISLLMDPLLINFPGSMRTYLETQCKSLDEAIARQVRRFIDAIGDYCEKLPQRTKLPEMTSPIQWQEAYSRWFAQSVERSMASAERKSSLLQLVHKTVLLYGNAYITHAHGHDGQPVRTESGLATLTHKFELPRMSSIDPIGLDYQIFQLKRSP